MMKLRFTPREPEVDPSHVAITFVDVLFALTAAKVFDILTTVNTIGWPGRWQLIATTVLIITSWVGYHTSPSSPRWVIRFFNYPFWTFVIDVVLVALYFLMAAYVQGASQLAKKPSAAPGTDIVAAVFALYTLWDWVCLRINTNARYQSAHITQMGKELPDDIKPRRVVTWVCFGLSLVLVALVNFTSPTNGAWIIGINGLLIALLLFFRVAKEAVTPAGSEIGGS